MAESKFAAISDHTDWLDTDLSPLALVEAALRCQVCKDFYRTPVITSCSHTFCSLCIRRALSIDGRCPLCRGSEQEAKLRPNWSVGEVVESFTKGRQSMLDLARSGPDEDQLMPMPKSKRKASQPDDGSWDPGDDETGPGPKRLRSSARLQSRKPRPDGHLIGPTEGEGQGGEEDADTRPEVSTPADDGLVPCPSCQGRMKQWQVFGHLDKCPGPAAPLQTPSSPAFPPSSSNQANGPAAPLTAMATTTTLQVLGGRGSAQSPARGPRTTPPPRLPAINYSMLREQALRRKMAELGLGSAGPRALLERRHREWLNIWNANCDAARPRKRPDLLRELDLWERTQGARAPQSAITGGGGASSGTPPIQDKNFDAVAWATKHEASYKALTARARESKARLGAGAGPEGGAATGGGGPARAGTDPDSDYDHHQLTVDDSEDDTAESDAPAPRPVACDVSGQASRGGKVPDGTMGDSAGGGYLPLESA